MNTRDWRTSKPGHEPMDAHDECSWCVLVLISVAAVAILLASACGLMP